MTQSIFQAQPFELPFDPYTTALIMIDVQRDFVEAGGFSGTLGNDVLLARTVIAPCTEVLAVVHQEGVMVIHAHKGHRTDLGDCPPAKLTCGGKTFTGESGPMGRILVRGGVGHDIIPGLYPVANEPAIDKPGKGAFYQTDLHLIPQSHGIKIPTVCGVTTEVCVTATMRETNDRGYECTIPEDCVGSYFLKFQKYALEMIKTQDAILDQVTDSKTIIADLKG